MRIRQISLQQLVSVYHVSSILASSVSSLKATFVQIHADHNFSKYLQRKQRRLSSHCLFRWDNDHMETPFPWCFHDLLQKFLRNSSSKESGRTKDNGQTKTWKILTPHHGEFFPTRNRDTEKLSSQVCKTHLGNTSLCYPSPNPILALSTAGGQRLQSPEVPFY